MEVGVLVLVCLSPWACGSVGVEFESVLYGGIALLLGCWAVRILLEEKLSWKKCPVTLVLAALLLCGVWQLMPLPHRLLSGLSPATAQMYEQLLPFQPEILPFGEAREAPVLSAGSTLSLYPGRTAQELMRLLEVLVLFVLVLNEIASPTSLRRLAIAGLVNGSLLSLFALIQFFTSRSDTLYWNWPTAGTVFGPFVCRNHFAFYLNLCVGLGVGLFLVSRYPRSRRDQGPRDRTPVGGMHESPGAVAPAELPQTTRSTGSLPWPDEPWHLLHHPPTLWITVALALMISSVVICASRGGIVALVGGWVLCLGISLPAFLRFRQLGAVLMTLAIVLGLVSWFGFARVEARLATLVGKEAYKEGRLSIWTRVLSLAKGYPLWGTGYGNFQYVEPLCRTDPMDEEIYSNAENEYLEGLVEGGVVRLVLSVLAIGLVFRLGYRAIRRSPHPTLSPSGRGREPTGGSRLENGLALGALFGFLTLLVQSFVDFGLHIPSIALLATVLCAQVCALNRNSVVYTLRLGGLAPVAGAALAVLCGLVLGYEGWRTYRAQELRLAAAVAPGLADSERYAHQVRCLTAAAHLAPEHARLHVDLALTHYDRYREQRRKLRRGNTLADAAQIVSDLAAIPSPLLGGHLAWTIPPPWLVTSACRKAFRQEAEQQLVRAHLVPALRSFLQARDLCPLLPEPQRFLANHADKLERADSQLAYLERAATVVPYDPGLWYWCGEACLEKQPDQAWKYWQRSLRLSNRHLSLILEKCSARLVPRQICDQVFPPDPKLFLEAALALYPQPTAERQPFLDAALDLFEKQSTPLGADDLHIKALILCALSRSEEAAAAYQAALAQEPRQASWRLELAQLWYQQKHLREAQQELLIILSQQPNYSEARETLSFVERKIAEGL
jgi:tetratricopeptide (TPR) repeat protein